MTNCQYNINQQTINSHESNKRILNYQNVPNEIRNSSNSSYPNNHLQHQNQQAILRDKLQHPTFNNIRNTQHNIPIRGSTVIALNKFHGDVNFVQRLPKRRFTTTVERVLVNLETLNHDNINTSNGDIDLLGDRNQHLLKPQKMPTKHNIEFEIDEYDDGGLFSPPNHHWKDSHHHTNISSHVKLQRSAPQPGKLFHWDDISNLKTKFQQQQQQMNSNQTTSNESSSSSEGQLQTNQHEQQPQQQTKFSYAAAQREAQEKQDRLQRLIAEYQQDDEVEDLYRLPSQRNRIRRPTTTQTQNIHNV
eukprot:UN04496